MSRTIRERPATRYPLPVPPGQWEVDPRRSSAAFAAKVAGGPVRGQLPLTGGAVVSGRAGSSTCLVASVSALTTGTGLLDRVILGRDFLDAVRFPEIGFRSDLLTRVPTGWRAVGQLEVKGCRHPLACELEVDPRDPLTITSRWLLDSAWITRRRVLGIGRHVAMTCSVSLRPAAA